MVGWTAGGKKRYNSYRKSGSCSLKRKDEVMFKRFASVLVALSAATALADATVTTWDELRTEIGKAQSGDTITLAKGDYTVATAGVTIPAGVTVCGATGDPADVVITDSISGKRAFELKNADSALKDLTVQGSGGQSIDGFHVWLSNGRMENCVITGGSGNGNANGSKGFNVYVSESAVVTNCVISNGKGVLFNCYGANLAVAGGLVVDCTIKDGYCSRQGFGSNVYISGGRLLRCLVTGGQAVNERNMDATVSCAAGIYATGGIIESCLIKDSKVAGKGNRCAGVYVNGAATIVNCTVTGNSSEKYGSTQAIETDIGMFVNHASAKIVNTILFNNGGTIEKEYGTVNRDRFMCCASTVANSSDAGNKTMSAADFDQDHPDDFVLIGGSPLMDAGTDSTDWVPATMDELDFYGSARKSGPQYDIGCSEYDQSRVNVIGTPQSFAELEGAGIVFKITGGQEGFLYRWDLGDGSAVRETSNTEETCSYPNGGLYAVKYTYSDDGGSTWKDWKTVANKVVIAPETIYVDSNGVSPAAPYKTPQTAATSIEMAFNALTNTLSANRPTVVGATICLCRGTSVTLVNYEMAIPMTICGATDDPTDAVIANATTALTLTLSDAGATLSNLTVRATGGAGEKTMGGNVSISAGLIANCILDGGKTKGIVVNYGGNVYMTGGVIRRSVLCNGQCGRGVDSGSPGCGGNLYLADGLVEDSLITDGGKVTVGGHAVSLRGGNVYMSGGRLVRCRIEKAEIKNTAGGTGYASNGGGIYATGGAVENCLVAGNAVKGDGSSAGGVYAEGTARIVNCTVIDNAAEKVVEGAGARIASKTAKICNTVVFNNGADAAGEYGTANLTNYINCASGFANADGVNCKVIDETAFSDWANRNENVANLKPAMGLDNPLANAGGRLADYTGFGAISMTDLLGAPRFCGAKVDLGCIEGDAKPGMVLLLR